MRSWITDFIRQNALVIGLVVIACVVVVPLTKSLFPSGSDDYERSHLALVAAHTRRRDEDSKQREALTRERDSVSMDAARLRVRYASQRSNARTAVAQLPPATIAGDTVTLNGEVYVVASPVATFVAAQQSVIRTQALALISADSAIAATVTAQQKSDSVSVLAVNQAAQSDSIATLQSERADHLKPGILARMRGALLGSTKVLIAGAIGYVAGKVL